ncbi:SARP family transcriptional regulator [Vallicoccus soli]|uniref:SARP family transcriptional regulator n=1 Tax=Vallicoccus soli TaxID=2339232 RepID=A0A3A3Z1R3_9ACTN|nr:SARP family transcriptional regulator [Vallicoccus soli]
MPAHRPWSAMEFKVLGPLTVLADGRPVDVGGPRQQCVLAVLLLAAPDPVGVEALVDAVWPDDPPATARAQVQICVSKLRQRLGAGAGGAGDPAAILTRPPGYALHLGDATFDLARFRAARAGARAAGAAGRPGEGAALLGPVLAAWRPPTLAGIESPMVRDAATRLDEHRVSALEELVDLLLAAGEHGEALAVLGPEVDRDPLRERLRAQTMLALHASGRQAEALAEFQRARRVLVDELGLEPGEELRRIEAAVLRGAPVPAAPAAAPPAGPAVEAATDPGTAAATPVPPAEPGPAPTPERAGPPHLLPAAVADFTGRSGTVAEVEAALSGGCPDGPAPVVVVSGPGGVGKSALAAHVGRRLAERFPDGQLFADVHGATRPVRAAQTLERFLRALGVPGPAVPDGEEERAELYRDRLAGRRLLVVLDDVATAAQVLPLLPPDGSSAVLLTSRRRVTALPGAHRVDLGTFSTASAVALLERVVGPERVRAAPEDAAEVVRLCGHLPLAVRIAAARLAARPHWSLATMVQRLSDEAGPLDELRHEDLAVRATLQLAYDTLDERPRALLRLLALVDAPDVGGWAAPALLGVPVRVAEDVLDELVEVHLLAVVTGAGADEATTRYRLHDLVRLFARERAAQEDAAALREGAVRRYLASLLHLVGAAHAAEHGGDYLQLHGDAPREPVDPALARRLLRDPLRWLASERAALVAAVAQAAAAGEERLCWDLAVSAVTLFEAHAHFDEWRETHEVALAAARAAGDELGEAAVRASLAALRVAVQQLGPAQEELTASLATFRALDQPLGEAMVLRHLAYVDRVRGDLGRAAARQESALALFRRLGDRLGEAHALRGLAQIRIALGRGDEAVAALDEASRLCTGTSRRVGAQVEHALGEVHLAHGRVDEARACFSRVLEFAGASGDPIAELYGLAGLGVASARAGDEGLAHERLERAADLALERRQDRMRAQVLLELAALDQRAGDLPAARGAAEQALAVAERLGAQRAAEAARDLLTALARPGPAVPAPAPGADAALPGATAAGRG